MARPEDLAPPSIHVMPYVPAWARPTHVPRAAQRLIGRREQHTAPNLVGRLDVLFDTPVGHKPYERNSNIEHDRDPRLNKGKQNRRGVDRE
jgi:hypothetical protein